MDSASGACRIDVHHHYAPPGWLRSLDVWPQPWKEWSPAGTIEEMDRTGTEKAVLSITTPGVWFGDDVAARKLARECNEFAATLRAQHPGRFGIFTVLPLPDLEGTLQELAYGLDTLHADGVGLLTSYRAKWLGDPYFAPVFEELDRRKAVVFVHPTVAECCKGLLPGIPDAAIEYGTDTTRAIARIVFGGSSKRYPGIRFIFSHAGGTMPFLNQRFVQLAARDTNYAALLPDGFLPEVRRFYYDTAQASNPVAMGALLQVVPLSQVVFGTDYPYLTIAENVTALQSCKMFGAAELTAITRENAVRLLEVSRAGRA